MDLLSASHDELIALIRQQQAHVADVTATVARLEQRVRDLERGSGPAHGMRGHSHADRHWLILVGLGCADRAARVQECSPVWRRVGPVHDFAVICA